MSYFTAMNVSSYEASFQDGDLHTGGVTQEDDLSDDHFRTSLMQRLATRFITDAPYQSADAFGQLYERTHPMVFRYIYGLQNGVLAEAEDLTAETFLRAWRTRSRFSGSEDAAIGWLFQIARHLVIDAYRRQRRQHGESLDSPPALDALEPTPEEYVLAKERTAYVWQLLATLPLEHRELMVLRYILGWQVRKIAQYVDQPENTISVTIRRILTRLRDKPAY